MIMKWGVTFVLSILLHTVFFSQRSDTWLHNNDQGNRYEGLYTMNANSNPSINLLSLTGVFENSAFQAQEKLMVKFYSPTKTKYLLKAEELIVTKYYWMQAKEENASVGWNGFLEWPVDFLLRPNGISNFNLGVLVRLGRSANSRIFSPAYVYKYSSDKEIEQLTNESFQWYVAQIQVARPTASGECSVYRGKGRNGNRKALWRQPISEKPAGNGATVFPLLIPVKRLSEEGWYFVEIELIEQETKDSFSYSFSFYHKLPS